MIVIRQKKQRNILLRPRCKKCHNRRERGHRREYKTAYLRRWRDYNAELVESYWKKRAREDVNACARRRSRSACFCQMSIVHHSLNRVVTPSQ